MPGRPHIAHLAWALVLATSMATAQDALEPPRVELGVEAEVPPGDAFEDHDEVAVVLRVTVDARGAVVDAEVVEAAGAPFDDAARAALLRFRFQPARRGETPIAARVLYRYVFEAPDEAPAASDGPPTEVEASTPPDDPVDEPAPIDEAPLEEEDHGLGVEAEVEVDAAGVLERSAEAVNVVDTRAQQHRAVDLGYVLARETGIAVQRTGGLGSSARFSLAGLTGDQVRFFLDGVPLEMAGYPFGVANVPVALVDRVEIYRGVVPIRLAADALGGVVNLVTGNNFDRTLAHGSYQTGSWGTYRGSLIGRVHDEASGLTAGVTAFGDRADNDYLVDVEGPDARGRPVPTRVRRFHDAYTAFGGSVDAGFVDRPWAERLTLRLFGSGYHKELQHDVVMSRPYGDVEYGEQVYGGTLVYEQDELFDEDVEVRLVTSLSRRQTDFRDLGDTVWGWTGEPLRDRIQPGEIDIASDRTLWQWTSFTRAYASWAPSPEHELSISITPTYVARTGDEREQFGEGRDPLTAEREYFTVVGGLSYRLRLFEERLENVAFVKYYYFLTDTEEVIGEHFRRLGQETHLGGAGDALRFRFDEWIWAKVSYEYATRLPSADEVFGDGILIGPNLALSPEVSHNVNVGAQVDLRDERGTGRWRGEVNLFARFAEGLIVPLGTETLQYENVADARSLGVEATVGWISPGEYVSVQVNGTYQDFRNTSSQGAFADFAGDRMPNRPWLFANARAALRWPSIATGNDALTLSWDARYVHGFFRGWESQGSRRFKDTVDEQLVQSLALSYRVDGTERVTTTFEVQNLTDERVYDLFGAQRPGRSVYLKLTVGL